MCVREREKESERERDVLCGVPAFVVSFFNSIGLFFFRFNKELLGERERGKQHVHGACDSVGAQDERLQRR